MRYVSVVILSLVILVLDLSTLDAAPITQQVTISNANKKDLCRPGMVFIPSTGTCGCPKTQYQDMNLSSGSRTVGDCKTLEHILEKRLSQEAGTVADGGCSSNQGSISFNFSTTSQRVHDVVSTRDGFIAAGLSRGSNWWSILKYNSDGSQYERLLALKGLSTTIPRVSSIKLAPLHNGGVMVLVNAMGPTGKYHLYANIIDAQGNMLYQDKWRLIPLNMEKETVFDVINIGGKFMVAYASPQHPNITGGTQKALVGFVLNRHLAMYREPTVLVTRDKLFQANASITTVHEPFTMAFDRVGLNRVLLNYSPQLGGAYMHLYGLLLDHDLEVLSKAGDFGSTFAGTSERVDNGGFFVLSDEKILAVSASKIVDGEIIVRNFDKNLTYHVGDKTPRAKPDNKTFIRLMGMKSFMQGDAYAVSWRDYSNNDSNSKKDDYYLSLFYHDHTSMGSDIKLGKNRDDSGILENSSFTGRYLPNQLFSLNNGNLLAVWGTKFRIIDGMTPHCHLSPQVAPANSGG